MKVSRFLYATTNYWRFSSEYAEDDTATVYYNYRHYEPVTGRWMSWDPVEREELNVLAFINNLVFGWDVLGERYGNPVTDQGGNPIGPSSPFDPGGAYDPDLEWYQLLPNCPCCIDVSGGLQKGPADPGWGNVKKANSQHPGAAWEVRWVDPEGKMVSGQQCTYDEYGKLITEPPAAGTPDMASFDDDKLWDSHPVLHFAFDLVTYWIFPNDYYFRHWPPNNGNNCPENSGGI